MSSLCCIVILFLFVDFKLCSLCECVESIELRLKYVEYADSGLLRGHSAMCSFVIL